MDENRGRLILQPCLDSDRMAADRRRELDIPRQVAAALGRSAVEISRAGFYINNDGVKRDFHEAFDQARSGTRSIRPDDALPVSHLPAGSQTRIQVTNETTLGAAQKMVQAGLRPLALNFANGFTAGGGFLTGARAQEEVLCRSSALFLTLLDDPMYEEHRRQGAPESSDWSIYSPDVPVFCTDDGSKLPAPWLLSFITCAAPFAPDVGQPKSGDLLQKRIHRVLDVARAFGHRELVLGAWGCGAFRNDAHRTAVDFRQTLQSDFAGVFSEIIFAVTDWSPERKYLGPFRDVFSPDYGTSKGSSEK